eukprot:g5143.t1
MATYQILACHAGEESKDSIFSVLKSRVTNTCDEVCKFDVPETQWCNAVVQRVLGKVATRRLRVYPNSQPAPVRIPKRAPVRERVFVVCKFDVPETLKFGSFDSLVKMMDDLAKHDGVVEGVLRRIERQMTELDANADFKVLFRQKTMTVESYVRSFQWDDTKWPRNRNVQDNMTGLLTTVQRIDDDVKSKAYTFADVKTTLGNVNKAKGPGTTLTNADMTEILTPDVVAADDFVTKEHLITVLVIVPRGGEKEFLDSYERVDPFVVPRSAKKFSKFVNGALEPIQDKVCCRSNFLGR